MNVKWTKKEKSEILETLWKKKHFWTLLQSFVGSVFALDLQLGMTLKFILGAGQNI